MSAASMDVFALRDSVISEYKKFATSFTTMYADDIREKVQAIYAQGRFWPEPLIQIVRREVPRPSRAGHARDRGPQSCASGRAGGGSGSGT